MASKYSMQIEHICPSAIYRATALENLTSKALQHSSCTSKTCHRITRILQPANLFSVLMFILLNFLNAAPGFCTSAPTITPSTGVQSTVQSCATITGDTGAILYYTTDGSAPTTSSSVYTTPLPIGRSATIRALASSSGALSTVTTAYILNDPGSLPVPRTGLQLWLRGDFGPLVTGSSLSQWSDLSGSIPANDATQSTMANQPTLVTGDIDGLNVVSFDGTSSYLTLASGLNNLSSGASIFAVLNPNNSGAKTLYTSGASGVTDMVSLQTNGTAATANYNNGATTSSITTPSGSLTIGKYQAIDAVHNGTASATIDVNTVSKITGTVQNLNTVSRTTNRLGVNSTLAGTSFWGGKVAELLVYSRALTTSENAAINAYFASKYQISSSTTVPTPIISPATSTLTEPGQVAISAIPSATTRVTINGTTPTTSSPIYTGPFTVGYTTTVKAIAVTTSGAVSNVATSTLTLNAARWPAPSATDTTPLQVNLQIPTTAIPY